MDIRQIMVYADNSRKLLRQTLAEHTEIFDRPFQTISGYSSVRLLIAHIIGAEERWIATRIGLKTVEIDYESRASDTVDGIFEDWDCVRARTHAFVHSVDTAGLEGLIPVSLPKWGYESNMRVDQILFHVFNHQVYHIGQISMALQHFGIDPPNFDFVFLHKELD